MKVAAGCDVGAPRPDVDIVPKVDIRGVTVLSDTSKLECAYCLEVLVDGVACHEGHSFCRVCIEKWLDKNAVCPTDRAPLKKDDLRPVPLLVRSLIDELQVRCPLGDGSCDHECQFGLLEGHMKICGLRTLVCGDCRGNMQASEVEKHKTVCDQATLACYFCREHVKRRDLDNHMRCYCNVCPFTYEHCMCGERILRKDLNDHVLSNVGAHFLTFAREVEDMRRQHVKDAALLLSLIELVDKSSSMPFRFTFTEPLESEQRSPCFDFAGLKFFFDSGYVDDRPALFLGSNYICKSNLVLMVNCNVAGLSMSGWFRTNGTKWYNGEWTREPTGGGIQLPAPVDGKYSFSAHFSLKHVELLESQPELHGPEQLPEEERVRQDATCSVKPGDFVFRKNSDGIPLANYYVVDALVLPRVAVRVYNCRTAEAEGDVLYVFWWELRVVRKLPTPKQVERADKIRQQKEAEN